MFTFLFDEYRAAVKGQYKSRFLIIYACMLGLLFIVGLALTVPTYVLLDSRLTAAEIEKGPEADPATETNFTIDSEVSAIKRRIIAIEVDSTEIPIATVLERILSKKGDDIRIDALSIRRNKETESISITGVAPSRDALVAFSKRLQGEPSFTKVNLPVGSLTRSKDVPFSITIDSKI